jgi:flagellin
MSINIRTNVSALYTQAALRSSESKMASTMEHLSTGLRVNSSKDDAAGMAIGQSMSTKILTLNQGVRNINDGINLIQTAESGLDSINSMLQRIRELSVQAANGTNSDEQRGYLNLEAKQLQIAINQVIDTTNWNEQNLLGEGFSNSFKLGAGMKDEFKVEIPKLSLFSTTFNTYQSTTKGSSPAVVDASVGELKINGVNVGLSSSLSGSSLATAINSQTVSTGVTAKERETVSVSSKIDLFEVNPTNSLNNSTGPFLNPINGHSYQFIKNGSPISWSAAKVAAENNLLNGQAGYLVTITSKQESDFILEKFGTAFSAWIGASDASQEEVWKWVTGPEAGTTFYTGAFPNGNSVGFSNWLSGQPVDFNGSEDFAAYWDVLGTNGWNDFLNSGEGWVSNYIVEHSLNNSIADNGILINGVNIGPIPNAATSSERVGQMLAAVNAKSSVTGVIAIEDIQNGGIKLAARDGRNIEISTPSNSNIKGSNTGIALNGVLTGNRLITTFKSGVDLSSISFQGIEVKTTGNVSAATGLLNQKVPATLTSSKKVENLIDIDSVQRATNALDFIEQGVDLISNTRARLGSYMNTLTHASDSLVNISTNLTASKSQILDADYSLETTNLASSQIVQQAATAVLAQANVSQKNVLDLLKDI